MKPRTEYAYVAGLLAPRPSIDQARAHALAILAMCDHAKGDHLE